MKLFRLGSGRLGSGRLTCDYNAISVQLQLQLPTGTELGKITHFGESLTFFQQKCEIFTKMKDLHENLTKKCKSAHNSPLLNTYAHLYLFQIFEPGGSDIVKNV